MYGRDLLTNSLSWDASDMKQYARMAREAKVDDREESLYRSVQLLESPPGYLGGNTAWDERSNPPFTH